MTPQIDLARFEPELCDFFRISPGQLINCRGEFHSNLFKRGSFGTVEVKL